MYKKLMRNLLLCAACACMHAPGLRAAKWTGDSLEATPDYFLAAEDSLRKLAVRIIEPRDDEERLANGQAFRLYFLEVMKQPSSFFHPFDSLTTVSFLMAPDSAFRMVTWYVPLLSRQFNYYGFIQFRDSMVELSDATASIQEPAHEQLSHQRWLGAYYYTIIDSDMGDHTMYTLLGWKGNNPETRMRIIEPLRVRDGLPVFGAQVFSYDDDTVYRIVFEYAARVSMNLVYEPHIVHGADEKVDVIAFDRLRPLDASYEGVYAYYVPEANIVDAFIFLDGKWVFVGDIDARNPNRLPAAE